MNQDIALMLLTYGLTFGGGLMGKIAFDWLKGNRACNHNSVDKKVDLALTKQMVTEVATDIKGVGNGINELKISAGKTNTLLGGILEESRETRRAIQGLKE